MKNDQLLNFVSELTNVKLITKSQNRQILKYLKDNIFVALHIKMQDDDDVKIISNSSQHLLVKILNFEASCKYGSEKWCISEDEEHWHDYVEDEDNSQYFLWTTRGDGSKNKAMKLVGFTLNADNGHFICCFDDKNQEVVVENLTKILQVNNIKFNFKSIPGYRYSREEDYDDDDDDFESGF